MEHPFTLNLPRLCLEGINNVAIRTVRRNSLTEFLKSNLSSGGRIIRDVTVRGLDEASLTKQDGDAFTHVERKAGSQNLDFVYFFGACAQNDELTIVVVEVEQAIQVLVLI